jgi:hypothetical protein
MQEPEEPVAEEKRTAKKSVTAGPGMLKASSSKNKS